MRDNFTSHSLPNTQCSTWELDTVPKNNKHKSMCYSSIAFISRDNLTLEEEEHQRDGCRPEQVWKANRDTSVGNSDALGKQTLCPYTVSGNVCHHSLNVCCVTLDSNMNDHHWRDATQKFTVWMVFCTMLGPRSYWEFFFSFVAFQGFRTYPHLRQKKPKT